MRLHHDRVAENEARQAKMLRQQGTGTIGVLIKAKQAGIIPRLVPR